MRRPAEREQARMRAHRVLESADPATVRWRVLCVDCEAESGELLQGSAGVIWQIEHSQATKYEHEVYLLAVFRLQGGEGRSARSHDARVRGRSEMEARCPSCKEAREVGEMQGLTVEYAGHKALPLVWCTVCGVVFVKVEGLKIASEAGAIKQGD